MTRLLEFHAFLLTNTGTRLDRFARALAATIRPGDTVLDLGAGSAILSMLACAAGARRAYAVESSDAAAFAHALLAGSPYRDRVEVIQARSFDITLPEPVDLVVADVHSTFGLQEQGLSAMVDARTRLMKPGGRIIPARTRLCVAPVEAPEVYDAKVGHWRGDVHGVNLEPLRALAVNTVHTARLDPSHLLAPAATLCTVDFAGATGLHVGGRAQLHAARAGTLHGLCGGSVSTLIERIEIGNLPGDPGTSNFAHAFLPLESPVAVTEGDAIDVQVDAYDGDELRWMVTVTAQRSGAVRRFTHSTFLSRPLSRETLRRRDPSYRPSLSDRGRLERDLLARIDGTRTLAELEEWLRGHAGSTWSRARLADVLVTTIARCG